MYAWPERICVDTALDAERRGATIRTYAEVTAIAREGEDWLVTLEERAPEMQGRAQVRARMVVNAAGPWIDRVPGGGSGRRRVIGIKGVNVMVRLPEAFRGQGLEAFSRKGEPYYVFPWRDFHFIGPTETEVTANPDDIHVEEAEIDYILGEANHLFPGLQLTRADVLHCWCGVRPTSTRDGRTTSLPVEAYDSLDAIAEKLDFSMISHGSARFDPAELDTLNARLLHAMPYAIAAPRLSATARWRGAGQGRAWPARA